MAPETALTETLKPFAGWDANEASKQFGAFLAEVREAWNNRMANARAFLIGATYGEDGRERALKGNDDPELEINFMLGVEVGPKVREAGSKIFTALLTAAVNMALAKIGLPSK